MIETSHGHIPYFQTPVPGLNPRADAPAIQKKSDDYSCLYDLFSLIVFPVGLARFAGYLADRTIVVSLVLIALPRTLLSSIFFRFCEPPMISTTTEACNWVNQFVRGVEAKPLTYTTDDGSLVDSISYHSDFQKDRLQQEQKWIVSCEPNAVFIQDRHEDYAEKSARLGVNILTMNYRGVGPLGGPWARSFEDLVEDVDAGVRLLLANGVQERNIVIEGLSLGGAVATLVAAKHQGQGREVSLLSQNTFSSISSEATAYVKSLLSDIWEIKALIDEGAYQMSLHPFARPVLFLFDSVASIIEIGTRVCFFALSCIENIATLQLREAINDLWSMTKVVVLNPMISALSIAGLPLSIIEILALLSIGEDWTPLLSTRIHFLTRTLNNYVASDETESISIRLAHSTRLEWLVKSTIGQSRWETDVIGAYMSLKGHRMISYCPHDSVIPYEASLAKAFSEKTETEFPREVECMGEKTSHGHTIEDAHEEVYNEFLERAFGVKLTYPLATKLTTDFGWSPAPNIDPTPLDPEALPFRLTISTHHAAIIHELVTTVGTSSLASLWMQKSHLQALSQQIHGHVNPLQYLSYVFSNPDLLQPAKSMFSTSSKRDPILNVFTPDLNTLLDNGDLQAVLPTFAQKTGCELTLLWSKARVRDWLGFCEVVVRAR